MYYISDETIRKVEEVNNYRLSEAQRYYIKNGVWNYPRAAGKKEAYIIRLVLLKEEYLDINEIISGKWANSLISIEDRYKTYEHILNLRKKFKEHGIEVIRLKEETVL